MPATDYLKQKSELSRETKQGRTIEQAKMLITAVMFYRLKREKEFSATYKQLEIKGFTSNTETWAESAPLETGRYGGRSSRNSIAGKPERCLDKYFITARGTETQRQQKSKILIKREHKDRSLDEILLRINDYVSALDIVEQAIIAKHFADNLYMLEIAKIMAGDNHLNTKTRYRQVGRAIRRAVEFAVYSK